MVQRPGWNISILFKTEMREIVKHCSLKGAFILLYESKSKIELIFFAGHDTCVEVLLEHEVFHKAEGNTFSPLHCAV